MQKMIRTGTTPRAWKQRVPLLGSWVAAAVALAMVPANAQAQFASPAVSSAIKSVGAPSEIKGFYKARNYRPLWIRGHSLGPEADTLLRLVETADLDGLDPDDYRPRALSDAIERAHRGSPKALAKAEMLLSRTLASYARDLRKPREIGMIYADPHLKPIMPTTRFVLDSAASAPSLQDHLEGFGWMNPLYGQLRKALAAHSTIGFDDRRVLIPSGPTLRMGSFDHRVELLRERLGLDPWGPFDETVDETLRAFQAANGLPQDGLAGPRTIAALNGDGAVNSVDKQQLLRINLERARALPANPGRRYIFVDAAAARLWVYEDGKVRDSMRVVVGKPTEQTPMMAGMIRYANVNPYWNIPVDLVQKSVAPGVLKEGNAFLRKKRYEILSDWTENARTVDPSTIDWKAVAAGRKELRVRQLPGPGNAMGQMKFMFPNELGIYLHDTPEKKLLKEDDRLFSSGCVRLEDAPRLARWLFGKPLNTKAADPDERVDLSDPVPVYITYMTAAPEGGRIAYRPDVYNRDALQLARLGGRSYAGRR